MKIKQIKAAFIMIGLGLVFSCGSKTTSSKETLLANTQSYISKIYTNKALKEIISEGVLTDVDGFKDIGSYKYYVLFDEKTNELYRIKNVETTDRIITENFYFENNKLIYISSVTNNSTKKLYLHKGQVISSSNINHEEQEVLLAKAKRFKKAF